MTASLRDRDQHTRAAFDAIVDAFLGLPLPREHPDYSDVHADCLHLGDLAITVTFPDGRAEAIPDSVEVRRALGVVTQRAIAERVA
jgi:hypothetical protein